MLWILLVISQCAFGFSIAHFVLKSNLDLIVQFIIGIPFGFGFSSFLFYFLSSFLAISAFHILIHISLLLLASIVLITFFSSKITKSQILSRPNRSVIIFLIISFLFSMLIVIPLYNTDPPNLNRSLQFDFNEEFSMMNSFYVGVNSGFTNPFKIRHPYCYKCIAKSHWLTALHSAMFLTSFSSQKTAILIPSFLLFYQFSFVFLFFSRTTLLKSDIYSILSFFVFLFAGSFGFIRWFWRDPRRDMANDFVFMWSSDKQTLWSHPILQYMFAFRPSLLSLSLIIDIVFLFYKVLYPNHKSKDVKKSNINNESLDSNSNSSSDINLNKDELLFVSLLSGALYGLTIPTQIEVTISFSIFIITFFIILLIMHNDIYQYLSICLLFITGFLIILIPQLFIILHFRESSFPILAFRKFWNPITLRGRFYGELVSWFEALGVFAGITIIVFWIHIIYVLVFSSTSSISFIEETTYALKYYLPSFLSFIFINHVQFHGEARQDIIAFYPCWMIFASIIFIYTFDSIITSIKIMPINSSLSKRKINLANQSKNENKTNNQSESDEEDDNETNNDEELDIDYNQNIHIRLNNNEVQREESHLEEIQGILLGWFSFFFVISVASALIGFSRLRSRRSIAYYNDTIELSNWIIKNANIKSLFYIDKAFGYHVYSAITSLSGRIAIYDSSLINGYYPNSFISPKKTSQYKLNQRLSRAGVKQLRYISEDLTSLSQNLTSKTLLPKLTYVINLKNSESRFNFSNGIPENWRLIHEIGTMQIYQRLN